MKREYTNAEKDGFYGCFYEAVQKSDKCMIILIGDTGDDAMNKWGARYLNSCDCHALGLGKWQDKRKDNGVYEWPLEYIEQAVNWLRQKGITKIGVMGASMGGNMGLAAASYIPDISLVVALCPCDMVLEGYHESKRDGMGEWCSGNSTYTWRGKPLAFQPYYCTAREYWDTYTISSKKHKEMRAIEIFRHSEAEKPASEECFIKVENIQGKILFFAAEDDSMWETAKYVRRMEKRLQEHSFSYPVESHIYQYGTHFVFPQTMLTGAFPVGSSLLTKLFVSGRKHPKECRQSRILVDEAVRKAIAQW